MDKFAEIRAKREGARRARRLAWSVTDDVIRERMLVFAQELEAEADALAWDRGSMELKDRHPFSERRPNGGIMPMADPTVGPNRHAATCRPASTGRTRWGRCRAPTPTPGSPR